MNAKIVVVIAALAVLAGCKDRDADEKLLHANAGRSDSSASVNHEIDGARVFFAYDSSVISNMARESLKAQAIYMNENPELEIKIHGHCDERGTREYNMALGARRANAAKKVFVANGVDAVRIETISFGKDRPLVPGSGEDIWQQNRAAVTVIE